MNQLTDNMINSAPTTGRDDHENTETAIPLPLRDRAWMPFHTVRAVGPVHTPPAARVRELLIKLWQADPWHPLLCRIDERRATQHRLLESQLPTFLDEVIIEAPVGADAADLTRLMQAMPLDGLPFRIALSDSAAAFRSAHVIGDTSTANPWFFALLRADDVDRALVRLTEGGRLRFPLARAVFRQFGRNPLLAVRALRNLFPLGPRRSAASTITGNSKININAQLNHGTKINSDSSVGVPDLVFATAAPQVETELRAWRKQHAPSVSMASVWMAAAVRGLRKAGLPTGDGISTMMNCRRYLPEDADVRGNFAVGPYLLPDDLADPNSLGTELAKATEQGVPLVLLSAMVARSAVRRGKPAELSVKIPENPQPKINLSYFGRIGADDFAWATEDAQQHGAQYVVAAEPAGPDAVTYVFAQSPYGMHLSATAYGQVTDVAALRAALRAVATDPIALLES